MAKSRKKTKQKDVTFEEFYDIQCDIKKSLKMVNPFVYDIINHLETTIEYSGIMDIAIFDYGDDVEDEDDIQIHKCEIDFHKKDDKVIWGFETKEFVSMLELMSTFEFALSIEEFMPIIAKTIKDKDGKSVDIPLIQASSYRIDEEFLVQFPQNVLKQRMEDLVKSDKSIESTYYNNYIFKGPDDYTIVAEDESYYDDEEEEDNE